MSAQVKEKEAPTVVAEAIGNKPMPSLTSRFAARFNIEPNKLLSTLKATAFRQRPDRDGVIREPSNEEMMALLVIAEQYHLNPFTRELYAFLDPKSGAIIPIVSVDGWIRIINERPELRGIEFQWSPETTEHKGKICHVWMECAITRSDRDVPVVIREYFGEVVRAVTYATPWDTHPSRMHRHKVLIQCARVAFGFAGLHDEDEAQRIIEGSATVIPEETPRIAAINDKVKKAAEPAATDAETITDRQEAELDKTGGAQPAAQTAAAGDPAQQTNGQPAQQQKPAGKRKGAGPTAAEVGALILNAKTLDDLQAARAMIAFDDEVNAELAAEADRIAAKLGTKPLL